MPGVSIVTPAESASPPSSLSTAKSLSSRQRNRWLSKSLSFNLKNFLPGGSDFALRRFSITEAAVLLMMAYITSRGLGVVRQTIFNAVFGTGPEASAYYAAAYLPETLFDLVAAGALTHAFVPVFLSYEQNHGQREAWRLASLVFNVLLVALTILVMIGEFLAPAFVTHLLVPGYSSSEQALTTSLTRVLLIQPLVLGLGTVITASLNSKRQFLLPAVSLAVYNVGVIAGLLCSLAIPGLGIYGPTFGILAAAVLQVSVMVPALVKQGAHYTFLWNLKHPGLREVLRLLIPNSLTVAITSLAPIVDTAYISFMSDKASLAAQRNAYMLFAFPVALVSQAVVQAALPQLAAMATANRYARLRQTLLKLLGATLVLSILASIVLFLFGKPAIHLLFRHGAFTSHSAAVTYTALQGYAIALPALTLVDIMVLIFYAMKDARTPLVSHIAAFAIHWGGLLLLLVWFTDSQKILAIPLAIAAAGTVQFCLLGSILYFRLRTKIKCDAGFLRLKRRRALSKGHKGEG